MVCFLYDAFGLTKRLFVSVISYGDYITVVGGKQWYPSSKIPLV